MRANYLIVSVCGVGALAAILLQTFAPTCLGVFVFGFALLLLAAVTVATAIFSLTRWRKESGQWTGPMMLCVSFWLVLIAFGKLGIWRAIDDWWFKRRLPYYSKIVDSLRAGALPCNKHLDNGLPPFIKGANSTCCADGGLWVVFIDSSSSAVGHIGFVYKDYLPTSECAEELRKQEKEWRLRHITGNWYRASD